MRQPNLIGQIVHPEPPPIELPEFPFANLQELSSWLAAAFDFTCARPMRSGLGAIKPLRVNAPSPFPVPHPETGRNDEGTWTKNGSVFANFGEAPTQEFTAGMQV